MTLYTLLSLATLRISSADVVTTNKNNQNIKNYNKNEVHRSLQLVGLGLTPSEQEAEWTGAEDPITCIATGSDFFDCCPSKSEDHGVCTLLHCVDLDSIELRANCDCAEVAISCEQVGMFAAIVPGLTDMCTAVDTCCIEDTQDDNEVWNGCMQTKIDSGDFEVPNFDNIIPGGVPEIPVLEPGPVIMPVEETTIATTTVPQDVTTTTIAEEEETALPDDLVIEGGEMGLGPVVVENTTTVVDPTLPAIPLPDAAAVPASVMCIAGGKEFLECCPEADPNDGICTLLWCFDYDEISIRDGCGCSQIETSCTQVAMFADIVEGLGEMCAAVDDCCVGDDDTDNDTFDTCLNKAIVDDNITVPDIASLMPNQDLPTLPDSTTETAPPVDVDPDFTEVEEDSNETSAASIYAATGLALIGSTLALLLV